MRQWKREYRLTAGVRGSEGFRIESGGATRPLHISFNLEKSDTQSSNTGTITISNLSDEHKAILNQADCFVEFYAGYGNDLGLVFSGGVTSTSEDLSGADRDFKVELIDGFTYNDLPGWLSLNGTVSCSEVLDKLVEAMEIDSAIITEAAQAKLDEAKYDNGFSFVGKLKAAMKNVLRKAGVTYSIQNGILQVYVYGESITPKAYVLSAETGLVNIPKKITISQNNSNTGSTSTSSTGTTDKGIPGYEVDFFLNPAIGVNDLIVLKSKTISGFFRVHKLSMSGDNYSGDWICTAQLVEVSES